MWTLRQFGVQFCPQNLWWNFIGRLPLVPITDATEVLVALVQLAALLVVVTQGTATILMAQRMMSGGDCWHVWKLCLRYNLRSDTSLFGQKHWINILGILILVNQQNTNEYDWLLTCQDKDASFWSSCHRLSGRWLKQCPLNLPPSPSNSYLFPGLLGNPKP